MLRQGPISRFLHGAIEYAVGVLLIAAPFLFGFESDAAVALSVVAGVLVLAVAASTEGPSSLIDSIPIAAHVLLDFALTAVLIAAPFLFGFSDESGPTALFIILGVMHLLVTIGTRFKPPRGFADRAGAGAGAGDVADKAPR
jgi:VIT1/CCC1 family predicted Fe2+/Mn2+ transporter